MTIDKSHLLIGIDERVYPTHDETASPDDSRDKKKKRRRRRRRRRKKS